MKILVVDDDEMACEMTSAILEDAGHTVLMANDAMDAVHQFDGDKTIEMIVSDMNMPLISGIDLFRQLRDQGHDLPFVLLTGDATAALLAQEPRLDACLLKDFDLEESLASAVTAVMQKRNGVA